MARRVAFVLLIAFVLVSPAWVGGGQKALVLKVLVPEEDAEILVDGQKIEGEGNERRITVTTEAKDKKFHIVTGHWEPNNYTRIARPRYWPT